MKKKINRPICLFLLAASAGFLASCGGTGASVSYASKPYIINYYDDATTPNLVGYTYAAPILIDSTSIAKANGSVIGHLSAYSDGSYYDYTSRSGKALSKVGSHRVFTAFAGTYADGTPVNLSAVTGDCSVYATFTEEDYKYDIVYYNDDNESVKSAAQTGLTWSSPAVYPDVKSYQQVDYADPSKNASGNWGYDYQNPSDPSKATPEFYSDLDNTKTAISSAWSFTSGETAPSALAPSGTLYAMTAFDDAHQSNPTYRTFLSNGSTWIELGNLAAGLKIKMRAVYAAVKHTFQVTFYDAKPTAGVTPNVLGSLAVPFNEVFTFAADGANVSATYGTVTSAFASSKKDWEGIYTHCSGVKLYDGKKVSDYRVMADCSFYPID